MGCGLQGRSEGGLAPACCHSSRGCPTEASSLVWAAARWAWPCCRPGCVCPLLSWVSTSLASPYSWRSSPQPWGLLALHCPSGPCWAGLGDPKGTLCPGWLGLVLVPVGTCGLGTIINSIPSLSRVWVWTVHLMGHAAEVHASHDAPAPDATEARLPGPCVGDHCPKVHLEMWTVTSLRWGGLEAHKVETLP